jgi:6-pyruvoyltetrahydropterin/6-carboxytetrahydropterin synthase
MEQRTLRVTKRFTFEMAHALRCHDGLCANIHGHSYVLDVTISGIPADSPGEPKDGMVIDFADLKRIVKELVVERYDHALVLHEREREHVTEGAALFGRTLYTSWQPTCENILLDVVHRLERALPAGVRLCAVRLQETATSWAEWQA